MCKECGMAYSFYFGTQYHKADCPRLRVGVGVTNTRSVFSGGYILGKADASGYYPEFVGRERSNRQITEKLEEWAGQRLDVELQYAGVQGYLDGLAGDEWRLSGDGVA